MSGAERRKGSGETEEAEDGIGAVPDVSGEDAGDGGVHFRGFFFHEEEVFNEAAVVETIDEGLKDLETLIHIGGVVG